MITHNPFLTSYNPLPPDEVLVRDAVQGNQRALETLLRRHQQWIFNIALRMLGHPQDAQDAAQEVLVKIATRLSTFRGQSEFRTWAYRIVVRHVLDRKKGKAEQVVHGFECYGDYLARAPDTDMPPTPEGLLLQEEAKVSCLLGMLLCLDREQRLTFLLGDIFEAHDTVAAEILGVSRDNFRQRLARARKQLFGFVAGKCGLVDSGNPCRCAKKTQAFMRDGIVDPAHLVFAQPHLKKVRETLPERSKKFDRWIEQEVGGLFHDHPMVESPDWVGRIEQMVNDPKLRELLSLDDTKREENLS